MCIRDSADPAAATHAGTVNHDRVEADERLHAIRLRGLGAELHHDAGPDRIDEVDVAGFTELLERLGDQALAATAAVIGRDDELVTDLPQLVLPEQQALVACGHDADDLVAGFLERPGDRIDRRHADPAAGADDRAHLLDLARLAQWTNEAGERVALAQRLQMPRRRADRLDHDGDGARFAVEIGDGERDPLPLFVDHQDDELSRLARRGNRRSLDDLHEHVIRIVDSAQYLVHVLFLAVALVKPLRCQPRRPMPLFTGAKVLPGQPGQRPGKTSPADPGTIPPRVLVRLNTPPLQLPAQGSGLTVRAAGAECAADGPGHPHE